MALDGFAQAAGALGAGMGMGMMMMGDLGFQEGGKYKIHIHYTALPIQPILPDFLVNGPNWQCCLAGSFKTAPRILIFSIVLGAEYSLFM